MTERTMSQDRESLTVGREDFRQERAGQGEDPQGFRELAGKIDRSAHAVAQCAIDNTFGTPELFNGRPGTNIDTANPMPDRRTQEPAPHTITSEHGTLIELGKHEHGVFRGRDLSR